MTFLVLCALLQTGSGYSAAPLADYSRVEIAGPSANRGSARVWCRWTVLKDARPAASGIWTLDGLAPGRPLTNAAPESLAAFRARGGDVALRLRFATGEVDADSEKTLAVAQIDCPRAKANPLSAYVGAPAKLTATADAYAFETPSQRIRFDRATGLLSGFATGWWSKTEWLGRPMAFDFGDPSPRVRLETFTEPVETNGVWSFRTVSWWKMSTGRQECRPNAGAADGRPNAGRQECRPNAGAADGRPNAGRQECRPNADAVDGRAVGENFEIRVATDWQVRGDGRVVSRTFIRPFGLRYVLPRVGWAFVLAPPDPLVQYYGEGPAAVALERDSPLPSCLFAGIAGLYSASVAGCGTHEKTRAVAFDAGSDHFGLSTLGGDFSLEVAPTASKATFCGIVVDRKAETDRDWRIDLLISPEKTLQAMAPPAGAGEG